MKLNAVGVASSNLQETKKFYELLGCEFPPSDHEGHIETQITDTSAKLMVDSKEIIEEIIGEKPQPGNHSMFAIEYDSPEELNDVAASVKKASFTVVKEPWDAFWGQRYCVVQDLDGYKVDLYAAQT